MMPALTLGWEYLTGYATATDRSNRERVEWPPHPARVFMALAAAWFETGEDLREGAALQWLESLDDPILRIPSKEQVSERSLVTVFVPVNDKAGPSAAILDSAPTLTRNRQPRTFPRVWVGEGRCFLHWTNAPRADEHSEALTRLCEKVTRIGHSSSLVRMWLGNEEGIDSEMSKWIPDEGVGDLQLRRVASGTLAMLADLFNRADRDRHEALTEKIVALAIQRKRVTGKGSAARKAEIAADILNLTEERETLNPRPPIRPTMGLWVAYRSAKSTLDPAISSGYFDPEVLILRQMQGPRLPIISSLSVTRALRGAVMAHCIQPPPPWVSGHVPEGQPLRDGNGHLAMIPLPFVGSQYADGHLLGAALVFPHHVDRRERGRVLGPLLLDAEGQPRLVTLTLGSLGIWTLEKRDWSETREALTAENWTAHPRGCQTWASVTPVVFDRFPKTDREKDRSGWVDEMCDIVSEACKRIGLPKLHAADFGTTCWHRGSPRAIGKRRTLRGQPGSDLLLGDGFPPYPSKGSNAVRLQMHVWLQFSEPIVGPIILGAGRFHGYGLCKPWKEPKFT